MVSHDSLRNPLLAVLFIIPAVSLWAAEPTTGYQAEVKVTSATRLDWQFACSGFGANNTKLPDDYDSTRQRYQLYIPKSYDKEKTWPMVVFVSPGDNPDGWRFWKKICEESGCFFCAAYAAGNNVAAGQRTRIVLDAFDDVRRNYHIDPDQTYLSGFSGGGRMACTIGYSLPEYFGGVIPICGTNPLPQLGYIRHRVQDRISVAFVTGETDFNRKENEDYMFPWFQDLKIRSKLWVVPKLGHGIPGEKVLAEIHDWLKEDLKRRQQDRQDYPLLGVKSDEAPRRADIAARLLETGESELKKPERVWRGVSLLQGAVARGEKGEAVGKAKKILEGLLNDAKQTALIEEQGGAEERSSLSIQAKAHERFGDHARAIKAWQLLLGNYPDTPEGKTAKLEIDRLKKLMAAVAYLGVAFEGESAVVSGVAPESPAEKAGLKRGDKFLLWGKNKVPSGKEVRESIAKQKPGDKVEIEIEREGKPTKFTIVLGSPPDNK